MTEMEPVRQHLCLLAVRPDSTDEHLLGAFVDRADEEAFGALLRRHGPMVFGVCRRVVGSHHDAEDAFQATFLVFARKASSVRPREGLAGWLHGVALRTARKARAATAKRRGREAQVAQVPEPEAAPPDPWHELRPLIDRELNGLPAYYRLPILLCDLEGKTIQEATRRLGWPLGTLAGRLARGRRLLAKRLANRGVMPSVVPLAAVLSQNATAAPPAALTGSTLQAAAALAAGHSLVAGVVPAKVASLTNGVLNAMLLCKLRTATASLLLVALLLGAAGAVYQAQAAGRPRAPSARADDKPGEKAKVRGEAADPDLKVLEGEWAVAGIEDEGKKAPPEAVEALKEARWSFKGAEVKFADPGEKPGGRTAVTLDSGKTPKHIDLVGLEGPKKGKTMQGVYKIEKDRLVVCLQKAEGGKRPDKFRTGPGSQSAMITLERVKK